MICVSYLPGISDCGLDSELIFFLHVTLLELTDAPLHQTGRRVPDLIRHADDRTAVT